MRGSAPPGGAAPSGFRCPRKFRTSFPSPQLNIRVSRISTSPGGKKTIEFFPWRGEKLRSGRNRSICAAIPQAELRSEGVYSRYTTEGSDEQGGLCKNRSPSKAGANDTKTGFGRRGRRGRSRRRVRGFCRAVQKKQTPVGGRTRHEDQVFASIRGGALYFAQEFPRGSAFEIRGRGVGEGQGASRPAGGSKKKTLLRVRNATRSEKNSRRRATLP